MKKLIVLLVLFFSLTLSSGDMMCYTILQAFSANKFKVDCGVVEHDYYKVIIPVEYKNHNSRHSAKRFVRKWLQTAVVMQLKNPKIDKVNSIIIAEDALITGTSLKEALK